MQPAFERDMNLPPTTLEDVAPTTQQDVALMDLATANNETSVVFNEIISSLDRIIAKQALINSDEASHVKHEHVHSTSVHPSACAPREGLIISNTLGRLANNLFEVGFANRLATELCWNVLFRPYWQGEIPSPRAAECFPHAMLPTDHSSLTNIPSQVQAQLKMNSTFWKSISTRNGNDLYTSWLAEREQEGIAFTVNNDAELFTGDGPGRIVAQIRNETSQISLLNLIAFFIHGDWMRDWNDKIREWFTMNETCCRHQPPDNAVVIHIRAFGPKDRTNMKIKPSVYTHILNHYNLTSQPIWIVCQPQTVDSRHVKELVAALPHNNVTIVPGQDQYDAFCTLTRAKILLLTSASTFSQMAAYLADPSAIVHYPLVTLQRPKVTLSAPGWKYHLVDAHALDRVTEFDVGRDKIRFKAA